MAPSSLASSIGMLRYSFRGMLARILAFTIPPGGFPRPSLFGSARSRNAMSPESPKNPFALYVIAQYLAQCGIQQVGSRVVGGAGGTFVRIYTCHERCFQVFGQLLGDMDRKVVLLFLVSMTSIVSNSLTSTPVSPT